jgi:hypothetical protein
VNDFPDDQWINGICFDRNDLVTGWGGICIHVDPSLTGTVSAFIGGIFGADMYLRKVSGLTHTTLTFAAHGGGTIGQSDRMTLELQGGMVVGGILKGFLNDVEAVSYVLTAPDLITVGNPGMITRGGLNNHQEISDIEAGDFIAGGGGSDKLRRNLLETTLVRPGLIRPMELPHDMGDFV